MIRQAACWSRWKSISDANITSKKNWQRLLLSAASLFVSKCVSLSEYDRAVAHATRSAEGSQGCREDADDDLQYGLPSFFLHSAFKFKLDMLRNSPEALLSS